MEKYDIKYLEALENLSLKIISSFDEKYLQNLKENFSYMQSLSVEVFFSWFEEDMKKIINLIVNKNPIEYDTIMKNSKKISNYEELVNFYMIGFREFVFLRFLNKSIEFNFKDVVFKFMKSDFNKIPENLEINTINKIEFPFLKKKLEKTKENYCPFLFFERRQEIFDEMLSFSDKFFEVVKEATIINVEIFPRGEKELSHEDLFLMGKLNI